MCLVALALRQSERYPLVVASNRDEFFERPSDSLAWWSSPRILGGRDLRAGGTWLAVNEARRFALVTNVRAPGAMATGAASRGEIVPRVLQGESVDLSSFAGVNVLEGDASGVRFRSNRSPERVLEPGIHGLSNASIDTPWPKVVALQNHLADALRHEDLVTPLFAALADPTLAPVEALPDTGVPRDVEHRLSAAFIRMPGYGTRCSTVLVHDRDGLHVYERTFTESGEVTERHVVV